MRHIFLVALSLFMLVAHSVEAASLCCCMSAPQEDTEMMPCHGDMGNAEADDVSGTQDSDAKMCDCGHFLKATEVTSVTPVPIIAVDIAVHIVPEVFFSSPSGFSPPPPRTLS